MSCYRIDPLHSEVAFKIRHMMISSVRGRFTSFDARMYSKREDFLDAKFECEIDVASIITGVSDRDKHLRSPDFFDCEKYPKMRFISKSIDLVDGRYAITGDLTIQGTKKSVTLYGKYNGHEVDQYGQTKFGFDLEGEIKRTDWFLDFNFAGKGGSILIGNEVSLDISIQMICVKK